MGGYPVCAPYACVTWAVLEREMGGFGGQLGRVSGDTHFAWAIRKWVVWLSRLGWCRVAGGVRGLSPSGVVHLHRRFFLRAGEAVGSERPLPSNSAC